MSNAAVETGTEHELIEVSRKDLPLSCPLPDAPVWNMHPRVYLPIEDEPSGEVVLSLLRGALSPDVKPGAVGDRDRPMSFGVKPRACAVPESTRFQCRRFLLI
jgi:uncharacterized Zn-finger protein